jgi:hypothetical protein
MLEHLADIASPALTEKENTFNTPAHAFANTTDEKEMEVERIKSLDHDQLDDFTIDPFKPFDDLPDERKNILTFRAIFVGCCVSAVLQSQLNMGLIVPFG